MPHHQNSSGEHAATEVVSGGTTLYVHEDGSDAGTADPTQLLHPSLVPIGPAAPTEFAPGAYEAQTRPLPTEAQTTERLPEAGKGTPSAVVSDIMQRAVAAADTVRLQLDAQGQPKSVWGMAALLEAQRRLAEDIRRRLDRNATAAEQQALARLVAEAWGVPAVFAHLDPLPAPGYENSED